MAIMNCDPSAFVAEPDLTESLRDCTFPVDCREDRELFHQGAEPTGLFVLNSGEVTMSLEDANDAPVAMAPILSRALLGLPAIIGDTPYTMTAVAKAGVRVGFVARDTFSDLMLAQPSLSLMMLRVLAGELRGVRIDIAEIRRGLHPMKSFEVEG